jgi:hypothetical protein
MAIKPREKVDVADLEHTTAFPKPKEIVTQ